MIWRWFYDHKAPRLIQGVDDYSEAQRIVLETPMDDKSYYVVFDTQEQQDVFALDWHGYGGVEYPMPTAHDLLASDI
jgi:hypothetical protein